MAQVNVQVQNQQQTQTLSPQQVLTVRLLELPVQEFEQRIRTELLENAALEEGHTEEYDNARDEEGVPMENDPVESVLQDKEDDNESYDTSPRTLSGKQPVMEEIPFYVAPSFYEQLCNQIGECDLTERERSIVEYIIGSLDDDGLLRKELWKIGDEMSIYQNTEVSQEELETALKTIQQFDPAGIGARSLQECLLLQIERKEKSPFHDLEYRIISQYYDEFTRKRWDKIASQLRLSEEDVEMLRSDLTHLNPRPGSSMSESTGHNYSTIIPDFLVDVDEDGSINLQLNNGEIPELHISQAFMDSLQEYNQNKERMNKRAKEDLAYTKQKIDRAQSFIEAVKQRQRTMMTTMQAIIHLQRDFFLEGDESLLKPMILKDVADLAKVDLSTVSRVSNSKYVQTPYGTFPLKYFFGDTYVTGTGEDVATRTIRNALKEFIAQEDRKNPLTDEQLAGLLKEKGYDVARRTVAKYRIQLGIPVARLRR